jgi:hypothetical protein
MTHDQESVLAIAEQVLKHAKATIDAQFGEGYAHEHPGLVMTYLSGSFGLLNATAKRLSE